MKKNSMAENKKFIQNETKKQQFNLQEIFFPPFSYATMKIFLLFHIQIAPIHVEYNRIWIMMVLLTQEEKKTPKKKTWKKRWKF